MKPQRIQLSRKKGWRMPENTVKVTRPGKWGNPFKVGVDGTAQECVDKFKAAVEPYTGSPTVPIQEAFRTQHNISLIQSRLRGKNLACWCPIGSPCHAEILLEIANR